MSLISELTGGGLTGGVLGAAFGALGSVVNRALGLVEMREKREDRQLEMAHEKDKWANDLQVKAIDAQADAAKAGQALAQTAAQGSWAGLTASVQADAQQLVSYPWVAAVRSLTRPALTVLLWLLLALLFVCAAAHWLEADTAEAVVRGGVETVCFSASTALAWWFGDRAPKRDG